MPALAITALTAVSALGRGADAHGDALLARRSGLRPNDFDPAIGGWIGRVPDLETHRLPDALMPGIAATTAWPTSLSRLTASPTR